MFSSAPVGSFEKFCGAISACTRHLMPRGSKLRGGNHLASVPVKTFECSRSHVNHSCRIKSHEVINIEMDSLNPIKMFAFQATGFKQRSLSITANLICRVGSTFRYNELERNLSVCYVDSLERNLWHFLCTKSVLLFCKHQNLLHVTMFLIKISTLTSLCWNKIWICPLFPIVTVRCHLLS